MTEKREIVLKRKRKEIKEEEEKKKIEGEKRGMCWRKKRRR